MTSEAPMLPIAPKITMVRGMTINTTGTLTSVTPNPIGMVSKRTTAATTKDWKRLKDDQLNPM